METPYAAFRRSVLTEVNLASGDSYTRASEASEKTNRVIAAAALVVSERGPQWCLDHPQAFRDLTLSKLGPWIKAAAFLVGLFTGGGSVWISLLAMVIPAVLELLQARHQSYGANTDYFGDFGPDFAADAQTALKAASRGVVPNTQHETPTP